MVINDIFPSSQIGCILLRLSKSCKYSSIEKYLSYNEQIFTQRNLLTFFFLEDFILIIFLKSFKWIHWYCCLLVLWNINSKVSIRTEVLFVEYIGKRISSDTDPGYCIDEYSLFNLLDIITLVVDNYDFNFFFYQCFQKPISWELVSLILCIFQIPNNLIRIF